MQVQTLPYSFSKRYVFKGVPNGIIDIVTVHWNPFCFFRNFFNICLQPDIIYFVVWGIRNSTSDNKDLLTDKQFKY